jgi:hypothetical protein
MRHGTGGTDGTDGTGEIDGTAIATEFYLLVTRRSLYVTYISLGDL